MSEQAPEEQKQIVFKGQLFEIEQTQKSDGRVFELARRAPGVRLIIANQNYQTLLLTKEFRDELNGWDYRLPGGKVFDTLDEYDKFRESGADIIVPAEQKAKNEAAEEAGVDVKKVDLFKKSTLGATVEWDLFVFEAVEWQPHPDGQSLESGEQIEADTWVEYAKVEEMIKAGHMQEERIALILLQWLARDEKV